MDKLTIINNALVATGNSRVNVLYDSSDEYAVADTTFDRAIRFLKGQHSWPFITTIEKLVRAPDAENKSRSFRQSGFRIPSTALHVKEIFYREYPLTEYEIMGQILSCRYDDEIYAKVVTEDNTANWHPMAEEVLTLMVEAGCMRGLNEDMTEAGKIDGKVENLLLVTRPQVDQQNPARNLYKSKIALARRTRRI